eukprot:TRINITY_DN47610_c0_g1_i1.p1 TRINITY_DN47610_c0_g1~~TRINITY_DN47610_c0_g1_i1.p1  ORF type:complete len:255 (+),score=71.90 TRINITY_DN47610_c0_g1_i1:35-766(+)
MFSRSSICLWSIPNFKGKIVSGAMGNNSAMINRNKHLLDSSLVRKKGLKGAGSASGKAHNDLAQSFVNMPLKSTISSKNTEFELMKGDLDRVLQHLIVILQKQIDANGRRETPQRYIWASCNLPATAETKRLADNPAITWVDTHKLIDVGYKPREASLINAHRDEVLFRIKRHFAARCVSLTLDEFTTAPPGFNCYLKWSADDDHLALTPEGQAVPVPRVDMQQPLRRYTRKGVGLGLHQTAM